MARRQDGRHFGFRPWSKLFWQRIHHPCGWGIGFRHTLAAGELYTWFLENLGADDVGGIWSDIGGHPETSSDKEQQIFVALNI